MASKKKGMPSSTPNESIAIHSDGSHHEGSYYLQTLRNELEKSSGRTIEELKEMYSEDTLFREALRHVTTTKKAICSLLDIPVEAACRYKRNLEKCGHLIESLNTVLCPVTAHPAKLISTNPDKFEDLRKSTVKQLKMF